LKEINQLDSKDNKKYNWILFISIFKMKYKELAIESLQIKIARQK